MDAGVVFDRHGIAGFVAALRRHDAMTDAEAQAILAAGRAPSDGRLLAASLAQRLVDRLGDGAAGTGWWRYEISEIGYNVDVTAFAHGDEASARQWEALCERDNHAAFVTRLSTMEALAVGLLDADGPRLADLIARWHALRARDAAFDRRDEAWRDAFRAAKAARDAAG